MPPRTPFSGFGHSSTCCKSARSTCKTRWMSKMAWPGNMLPQTRLVRTDTPCTDRAACVVARANLAPSHGDSRKDRTETQEAARAQPRADPGADRNVRATNKRNRVGQHQQGNAPGDGEGQRGDEANTRQAHPGEGGRDNVCSALKSAPLLFNHMYHTASMAERDRDTGTSYGSKMRSAKRSSTPSRATKSENPSTRRTWRQSSTNYSRRRWTSKCSRLEQCRCRIRSSGSPPHLKTVSLTKLG